MSTSKKRLLAAVAPATDDELLNTDELAELLGVHPGTLAQWRSNRRGPAYLKSGRGYRRIWYRCVDVEEWLKETGFVRYNTDTGKGGAA